MNKTRTASLRTPVGLCTPAGALTLTRAESAARACDGLSTPDGRDLDETLRRQRMAAETAGRALGLAQVEIYASDRDGGCMVDVVDVVAVRS